MGKICYESSHKLQVSGSEEGVESFRVCVVVMNVQSSPSCGTSVGEVGMSKRRFGPIDDNAGVDGGKDSGISISIMLACVEGMWLRC